MVSQVFFVFPSSHGVKGGSGPINGASRPRHNPPLKINMLLHFYAVIDPFAPEATRTSRSYTQFVKELLRDGLIERPTKEEREQCPGWAYRTTAKGDAFVNAICTVPMPVERTQWVIPAPQRQGD